MSTIKIRLTRLLINEGWIYTILFIGVAFACMAVAVNMDIPLGSFRPSGVCPVPAG